MAQRIVASGYRAKERSGLRSLDQTEVGSPARHAESGALGVLAMPTEIRPEDLMGTQEVAEYLGWTTGQVTDYARRGIAGMPVAIAHLRCGRIWVRPQIEEWACARGYVGRGSDRRMRNHAED